MRKGMSRVSSNVLTDGGDISHNIMPQRQLPSSVTEAKLNFYDNLLTITFTETQSQILILFANVLSLHRNPSLRSELRPWGEKSFRNGNSSNYFYAENKKESSHAEILQMGRA